MMKPAICILIISLLPPIGLNAQDVLLDSPDQIRIEAIDAVNSPYRETNLTVSPDGQYLFWMSGRGGQEWSVKQGIKDYEGQTRYDGDIWYSRNIEGEWQPAECLPRPINSSSGEDEPNLSPNAQKVYFQSWDGWDKSGGPYYQAEFNGLEWENRQGLGGGIHAFFRRMMGVYGEAATDGATMSADGRVFVVAAGPDYMGNMDIYISRKDSSGQWSYPKKLPISTDKDERSVFLAADGQSLYFASNGYDGAGGLDIYRSTLFENDSTGPVQNLGAPFNTTDHDYSFVLSMQGDAAYFIRNGDIYYADIRPMSEALKASPGLFIKGFVRDSFKEKIIPALVELHHADHPEPIQKTKTHPGTGEFLFVVPFDSSQYELHIKSPGYTLIKKEVQPIRDLDENMSPPEMEINMQPGLYTIDDPEKLISEQDTVFYIYFDTDSDELNQSANEQMKAVVRMIKTHRIGRVKLLGHTDNRGSLEYNEALSQRRVNQVADYLMELGYPAKRLIASHYGEEKPIAENSSEIGMQQNRRVEVRFRVRKK